MDALHNNAWVYHINLENGLTLQHILEFIKLWRVTSQVQFQANKVWHHFMDRPLGITPGPLLILPNSSRPHPLVSRLLFRKIGLLISVSYSRGSSFRVKFGRWMNSPSVDDLIVGFAHVQENSRDGSDIALSMSSLHLNMDYGEELVRSPRLHTKSWHGFNNVKTWWIDMGGERCWFPS